MAMSPRARRELEAAFDRRVQERRAQMAPRLRHAEEVGRRLGHAEVSAVHSRDFQHPASTALGVFGLLTLLSVVPGAAVIIAGLRLPSWVAVMYGAAAVVVAVTCFVRMFRFERVGWVYVYPDGLAVIGWNGSLEAHLRWADVVGADWSWGTYEDGGGSVEGIELRTAAGWRLPLSGKYRNALDPYAPVGAMVAAMAPRSVGSAFPRFPSLAEAVDEAVVSRLVAQVLAQCAAGGWVGFGPVTLDGSGITLAKRVPVSWTDVGAVDISSMQLRIRRSDGERTLKVSLDNVPDGWVLVRSIIARTAPTALRRP